MSKVTRHTDRIIASKTKNLLSKFSQSNFSDLEFRGLKSHSRCSNLFSKFGMQLRGKSSDLDQDESILADRRLTPRNPIESASVRESYGSNYGKTQSKLKQYSKISSLEDLIRILEHFSELKKFQIQGIKEFVQELQAKNVALEAKLDENSTLT